MNKKCSRCDQDLKKKFIWHKKENLLFCSHACANEHDRQYRITRKESK